MLCSKSALAFLAAGLAAFLMGMSVVVWSRGELAQLYGVLWLNIAAIFWVGAGIISKLQHLLPPPNDCEASD
jgi:hypothetical protein